MCEAQVSSQGSGVCLDKAPGCSPAQTYSQPDPQSPLTRGNSTAIRRLRAPSPLLRTITSVCRTSWQKSSESVFPNGFWSLCIVKYWMKGDFFCDIQCLISCDTSVCANGSDVGMFWRRGLAIAWLQQGADYAANSLLGHSTYADWRISILFTT